MRVFGGIVAILGSMVLVAGDTEGQTTGDIAAGKDFALQVCTPCHVVASDQRAPRRSVGPDFRAIANIPSTTSISLRVFLSSPHPTMPNLILSKKEQDDVIAYIISLRNRP
jgi:cytochrome c